MLAKVQKSKIELYVKEHNHNGLYYNLIYVRRRKSLIISSSISITEFVDHK